MDLVLAAVLSLVVGPDQAGEDIKDRPAPGDVRRQVGLVDVLRVRETVLGEDRVPLRHDLGFEFLRHRPQGRHRLPRCRRCSPSNLPRSRRLR